MRVLAIDLGSKRIGTAISDALGISVRPVETIKRTTRERDLQRLKQITEDLEAEAVVVGLPLRLDGTEGDAAHRVLRFAAALRQTVGVEVFTHDERLTSYEAERTMAELGYDQRRRRKNSDGFAAMIILKDYLASFTATRKTKP